MSAIITHDVQRDCQRTLCGLITSFTLVISSAPTCKNCQRSTRPESERAQ